MIEAQIFVGAKATDETSEQDQARGLPPMTTRLRLGSRSHFFEGRGCPMRDTVLEVSEIRPHFLSQLEKGKLYNVRIEEVTDPAELEAYEKENAEMDRRGAIFEAGQAEREAKRAEARKGVLNQIKELLGVGEVRVIEIEASGGGKPGSD